MVENCDGNARKNRNFKNLCKTRGCRKWGLIFVQRAHGNQTNAWERTVRRWWKPKRFCVKNVKINARKCKQFWTVRKLFVNETPTFAQNLRQVQNIVYTIQSNDRVCATATVKKPCVDKLWTTEKRAFLLAYIGTEPIFLLTFLAFCGIIRQSN